MTNEQVIQWARDAGFHFHDAGYAPEVLHTDPLEYSQKCFERFAALVRNATLEEAAGLIEDYERFGDTRDCAAAIRGVKT